MNIRLELIDDIDAFHPTAAAWWQGHGWPVVPKEILPKLGLRALADDGTRPVAATWLYMDNSVGVSMLEWTVADPAASPRLVAVALSHLVRFARQEAKRLDYAVMLTTCRQESLSKLLQRSGFQETDREMIHLLSVLD